MADFVFGDFSEQEAEKLFDNDKQGVKFPWTTDDCLSTAIEFGFDIPPVISPSGGTGVSYSCNGSLSHQESTNSALTSPPYSSKSSSVENMKISKQSSSSHTRHHSDRKSKKKRPPGYYTQEYQQMLEPSTLNNNNNYNQNDLNEQTPKIEQNPNDERYISCDQWVDSTIKHQHNDKQSTNDDDDDDDNDEIESDSRETTTDTDNDNEHPQPITINKTNLNTNNPDTSSIYSTSVASAASIETLKPSSDNLSSSVKSKPSSWAALFRGSQPVATTTTTTNPSQSAQAQQSSPVQKVQPTATATATTSQQQNGARTSTTNAFHSKPNYHVYNSNGEDSRTLEDYFSKCEVRPSAMAIKPRGLLNKSNYCYVNATLQALLACPAFFNVMKHIPLNEDTDNNNVPCIRALHSFVNQFEKMDRSKPNTNHKDIVCGNPFEPTDILQELSRLRNTPIELVKSKQEDAHELLCQLLSEIHDEICQILHNSNKNEESTSSSDLSTLTADLQLNGDEKSEDWLQVGKRNRTHVLRTNEIQNSLVTKIFAGKFRSIVHSSGNQKSVVNEPFFTLSLDIKDPKITTLDDALLRFCEQSAISDYVDSKNRQNIHTNKTMLIEQLPPILIVHLKCFLYDEADGIKKVNKSVNYTVNLTLPKNILTEQARKHANDRYKLFAVEYHQGEQATKGHYITDVFHPGLQGWLRFDDTNVQIVTSNQVINPTLADRLTPYLLFYRRD